MSARVTAPLITSARARGDSFFMGTIVPFFSPARKFPPAEKCAEARPRPRALPRMGVEPQMGNDTMVLHNQGDKNMASDSAVTLAACIQAAAALVAADKFGDHTAGYPADAVGQLTYQIQKALGTERPKAG